LQGADGFNQLRAVFLAAGDGQHQRVDDQIANREVDLQRAGDQLLQGDVDALVGADRDAALAHRQGDQPGIIPLGDQRHLLQPFFFRRGGVDDRLGLGDLLQPGLDAFQVGAVEAEGNIDHGFDRLDDPGEDLGAVLLARAEVEVQRLRPGFNLPDGQLLEEAGVPGGQGVLDALGDDVDVLTDDIHGRSFHSALAACTEGKRERSVWGRNSAEVKAS